MADDEIAVLYGGNEPIRRENLHTCNTLGRMVSMDGVQLHEGFSYGTQFLVQSTEILKETLVSDGSVPIDDGVPEAFSLGIGAAGAYQVKPGQRLKAVRQISIRIPTHFVNVGHPHPVPSG